MATFQDELEAIDAQPGRMRSAQPRVREVFASYVEDLTTGRISERTVTVHDQWADDRSRRAIARHAEPNEGARWMGRWLGNLDRSAAILHAEVARGMTEAHRAHSGRTLSRSAVDRARPRTSEYETYSGVRDVLPGTRPTPEYGHLAPPTRWLVLKPVVGAVLLAVGLAWLAAPFVAACLVVTGLWCLVTTFKRIKEYAERELN